MSSDKAQINTDIGYKIRGKFDHSAFYLPLLADQGVLQTDRAIPTAMRPELYEPMMTLVPLYYPRAEKLPDLPTGNRAFEMWYTAYSSDITGTRIGRTRKQREQEMERQTLHIDVILKVGRCQLMFIHSKKAFRLHRLGRSCSSSSLAHTVCQKAPVLSVLPRIPRLVCQERDRAFRTLYVK